VKHGIFLPPFSELADPRRVARLAADAEQAGWDGFYLWDHMLAVPGMAVAGCGPLWRRSRWRPAGSGWARW
jgi:alkanesulfonate monooxygenase SsuD/methylene tetrahydromethanopterin reductase-like flavin-dependent oxidoreductase (luciferase family)